MVYFDYDGVLQDTWEIIHQKKIMRRIEDVCEFYSTLDWRDILENSKWINDNVEILKNLRSTLDVSILTSISSLNEGIEKVKWIKMKLGDIGIVLVPYGLSKTDLVLSKGNVLIDDHERNISEWIQHGGVGFLYSCNSKIKIEEVVEQSRMKQI